MTTEKKIALVTGGNRGLGFETCRQLAQLGLSVILSARDTTKGEIAVKQLIDIGLDVVFHHLDVSDQSYLDRIVYQPEQKFDLKALHSLLLLNQHQKKCVLDATHQEKQMLEQLYPDCNDIQQ
ncbi:MAG: hypothetical protein DLM72_11575 [Candidatus Nitrosopolaris wilkensis]|nr:MAG: hypothetical protein DLM72_11575 [Candidatus Nitrosopolaris wilkensis]